MGKHFFSLFVDTNLTNIREFGGGGGLGKYMKSPTVGKFMKSGYWIKCNRMLLITQQLRSIY